MTTRLGFMGGGFIARYHAMMLGLSEADAEIVAVHDPDVAKAGRFVAETGAELVSSEAAVFDRVDAVYVCTWTAEHPRLVAEACRRELPVFCEKPLAVDLASAVAMVEVVRAAGVINQVGLVMRDYPGFQLLRHLLGRPGAGRVMSVVFRDDQYIPIQGAYDSEWRADPARCGAGTLLEHSVHDLDILEWMLGPVVSVAARTSEFHDLEGIDDVAVATIEFEQGTLATLTSVWHDVLERPSLRRVEVFSERAHAVLEGDVFGPVRWTGPDGDAGSLADEALVGYLTEQGERLRNPDGAFVEAVRAGGPASPSFADALRAHVLVDAVYRSAAAGGAPVAVPPGVPTPVDQRVD
jgi:UDP-N-acetyl-2-amino-2-deoxyglucuronate dehydrogenase